MEETPEGYVTRRTLCEKVGLTDKQFRALAVDRVIASDGVNGGGYAIYKTSTVERLLTMKGEGTLFRRMASATTTSSAATPSASYSAEEGVRVFELLRDGKSLEEIILTTRIHPLLVKAIRIDYDDITGSIHLSRDIVSQLNDFGSAGKLPGGFPLRDANDIFSVMELCAIDRTCSTCEANPALTSCESCLVHARRAARTGTDDAR